jgi:hypothetical protein
MPETSRCVAVIVETEGGPVVVVVLWPRNDEDDRPAPAHPTPVPGGGWSLDLSDEP